MARSIVIENGSLLIGSPIEVSVRAEVLGGNVNFHRVRLTVAAYLSSGISIGAFVLHAPAESGEFVKFDISDALRTVASSYSFSPVTGNQVVMPYITYTLSASDEYMREGILNENVAPVVYEKTMYALFGSFTDWERFKSVNVVSSFTRKPASGEVCSPEETVVYVDPPAEGLSIDSQLSSGPVVKAYPLAGKSGKVVVGGREIFVDENARDRRMFQFVNGMGVVESVSAETLYSAESSGTSEFVTVTAPAGYRSVNRMFVRKSGRRVSFKMSSGYVTGEWARWWHDEFLGSDNFRRSLPVSCWMYMDNAWVPCSCVLDEEVDLYDKSERALRRVDFTVHPAFGF